MGHSTVLIEIGSLRILTDLLYSSDWPEATVPLIGAPAVDRQLVAWLVAAGVRAAATGVWSDLRDPGPEPNR